MPFDAEARYDGVRSRLRAYSGPRPMPADEAIYRDETIAAKERRDGAPPPGRG